MMIGDRRHGNGQILHDESGLTTLKMALDRRFNKVFAVLAL